MAEIDFFFNSNEKFKLLSFLEEKGIKFVPDLDYPSESYIVLKKADECLDYLTVYNEKFFLLHDSYFREKLSMRPVTKNNKLQYYIGQRECGPAIDIFLSSNTENKTNLIIGSNVGHYPYYWDKESKYTTPASKELKTVYSGIVKFIKKQSVRLSTLKRHYWIGQETINDLIHGKRLANIDDKFQDDFIKSYLMS